VVRKPGAGKTMLIDCLAGLGVPGWRAVGYELAVELAFSRLHQLSADAGS
jgi:hypothetical protein